MPRCTNPSYSGPPTRLSNAYYIRGHKSGKNYIPYGTNPPPRQTSFQQQQQQKQQPPSSNFTPLGPSNAYQRLTRQHFPLRMNTTINRQKRRLNLNDSQKRIYIDRSRNGHNLQNVSKKAQPETSAKYSSRNSNARSTSVSLKKNQRTKKKASAKNESKIVKKVCIATSIQKLYQKSHGSTIVPNIFSNANVDGNGNGIYAISYIIQKLSRYNEKGNNAKR